MAAWLSFSRDGRQILYAAAETKSHLIKAGLDPATARLTGSPVQITEGSQPVRSGSVSPDGEWIVFDSDVPREDLFLIRSDGSGLRQLTNDAARDRSPRWFPDGRIVFYSDRTGKLEAWALSPQDGRLEQLTDFGKPVLDAFVSPDGRWLACRLDVSSQIPVLVDLQVPLAQRAPVPLKLGQKPAESFAVYDWSRDQRWLAGHSTSGLLLYSFDTESLSFLGQPTGQLPVWLDDGRKLLFVDGDRVRALDLQSRRTWNVLVPPAYSYFGRVSLSADGRTLYAVRGLREGDIWLLKVE
jgi:Tol biopolymer transport system component